MPDRLAIVAYIFGERYQSFAPLYAYSIIESYPEYAVLLYFDRSISSATRERLNTLAQHADVRYREAYDFGIPREGKLGKSSSVLRAGRWLFHDPWFDEFRWIYIGDVDILVLPEQVSIMNSHRAHADYLSLPYSNMVRLTADARYLTPGAIKALLVERDYQTLSRRLRGRVIERNRLTGLHFVERSPYFDAVGPQFTQLKNEIATGSLGVRSRDDEEVLYTLVERSGIPLPPVGPTGPDLDASHFNSVNFRPHHGIHLGIFRSGGSILRQRQVLNSYVYRAYYHGYARLRSSHPFQEMVDQADPYVAGLIGALDRFITP